MTDSEDRIVDRLRLPDRPAGSGIIDAMSELPIVTLRRWEDQGAVWRAVRVTDTEAVVELCTCTGELVERLRSSDPELLRYLHARTRSDPNRAERGAGDHRLPRRSGGS